MLFIDFFGQEKTIQDCIDLYEVTGITTLIENGKVIGFQQEEIPIQVANLSVNK